MKKYPVMLFTVFISILSFYSCAPSVVSVRPAAIVKVRPIAPSPRHVWVNGNYVWRGGRYVYVDGYWAPPRSGRHWVDGYWKLKRGGYVWVPGRWR